MPKQSRLEEMLDGAPQLALQTVESTVTGRANNSAINAGTHPQDRIHSGMFGEGEVVELLKNAEGYAYGHRIRFENGMEAELLITDVPTRH